MKRVVITGQGTINAVVNPSNPNHLIGTWDRNGFNGTIESLGS